jgi:hypothetical protein
VEGVAESCGVGRPLPIPAADSMSPRTASSLHLAARGTVHLATSPVTVTEHLCQPGEARFLAVSRPTAARPHPPRDSASPSRQPVSPRPEPSPAHQHARSVAHWPHHQGASCPFKCTPTESAAGGWGRVCGGGGAQEHGRAHRPARPEAEDVEQLEPVLLHAPSVGVRPHHGQCHVGPPTRVDRGDQRAQARLHVEPRPVA